MHTLADRAYFQRDVQTGVLLRVERERIEDVRAEPGGLRGDTIDTGRQLDDTVDAGRIGFRAIVLVALHVGNGHLGVGDDGSCAIGDDAGDERLGCFARGP